MSTLPSLVPAIAAAYLGPPASFSHQAALNFFAQQQSTSPNSPSINLIPHPTFSSIFAAVQSSPSSSAATAATPTIYGVVPFENSSNGSVVQLLDLLADRDGLYGNVKVCAEYYLRVRHCLLGRRPPPRPLGSTTEDKTKGALLVQGVQKLYTHPQAWGQCSAFLDTYFRGVERQDVSSTSRAAEVVAQEENQDAADTAADKGDGGGRRWGKSAAIASQLAAEVYGLDVLREGIEDQGDNVTRFFVLRREDQNKQQSGSVEEHETNGTNTPAAPQKYKSLISFTIAHGAAPGALADALGIFRQRGFNLTSIDTRPSRVRPWHYIFFVECEQAEKVGEPADRAAVDRVLEDLGDVAQSCRHLGRWRHELGRVEAREDLG